MVTKSDPAVHVVVYDHANNPLEKARVRLEPLDPGADNAHELRRDVARGGFVATGLRPGRYILRAAASGLAAEEREVQVDPAGLETLVILGKPGLPFLYRGDVKVPFEPHEDLVGVALEPATASEAEREVAAVARRLRLRSVRVGNEISRQHVLVYRLKGGTTPSDVHGVEQELAQVPGVSAVGSVVRLERDSVSFVTGELVVRFKSHVVVDEIPTVAKSHRLTTLRRLPQAGNAFLFRSDDASSYDSLRVAAALVESGLVEYAEPNLFSSVVEDVINPTDFLYGMQWHLPLINCPAAWQVINDNIAADFAFGSPNINIAVVDSGVDVGNPDFTGNVSNGSPKVYQVFDFQNMVANNNTRSSGHGTCCAGIATALANNPAGVGAQNEGVAGSAGNCRLMAIERPSGSEVAYSDMYTWAGGFNPGSITAGFPAQISPGADVITNSFGSSIGMPISGLMKDTFDLLTTYGRGGRGVLLFFSAGNAGVDFTLQRPWAAYTRTFAVAASTLATDGVTEIRAPYSNFGGAGTIDFCAPSDRPLGGPYNPPVTYGTVSVADRTAVDFPPDAPSHVTTQTTTSGASAAGATNLAVASSAGFAAGAFLVIGSPGTAGAEFGQVGAVPDATHLTVNALHNAHPAGTPVFTGPANSFSSFGGTSSATPLSAGVGALLLTIRPSLTWIQVRDILRSTAVRIDAANTNATGIWTDQNGTASNQPGYLGPLYSRWYGSGRIDALAAANAVLTLGATADVVARDNLGDSGIVPAVGTFWNSPDIWVRNASPATEGAAALPANYATPGPTQDAIAGQTNYIYVRVKNNGPVATSSFYTRVYLAHWPGTEFVYPTDFIPTTHPSQPLPSPLVPGTYLIGEVQHASLAPNASDIVNVTWPPAAIPPESVVVSGTTVHWHPCLLVEISPQDGPNPTGVHVWDNNNLAQKNVTISYADAGGDFAAAIVVGNLLNRSKSIELVFDRSNVPASVRVYVDVLDPRAKRALMAMIQVKRSATGLAHQELMLTEETRAVIQRAAAEVPSGSVVTLPKDTRVNVVELAEAQLPTPGITLGHRDGREVFWLPPSELTRIPLHAGTGALIPLIVGGVFPDDIKKSEVYIVGITQLDADGRTSGAAAVEIHRAER